MGGSSKETKTTNSTATTEPWRPTHPGLFEAINNINGQWGNVAPTGTEKLAWNQLAQNAQSGNQYAPAIGQLATDLLNGGTDRSGDVTRAYENLQHGLLPYAGGDYLDPYSDPAFLKVMDDVRQRATNQVNATWAAAGRDMSPGNARALGEGIASATAPLALDWYNKQQANQMAAINALYNAGNTTAGLLSGLDQTALANRQAGVGVSTAAKQAEDSPWQRLLEIENMRFNTPVQRTGALANLLLPIAQTGSQRTENSTSTTERSTPIGQQIMGGILGGLGMVSGLGGFGPTGWLLSSGTGGGGFLNNLFGGMGGLGGSPVTAFNPRGLY
jgi:hypothetical protein